MKKAFIFLVTFCLVQIASADETALLVCNPLSPTQEFKEIIIGYTGDDSYLLTLITGDSKGPIQYKAEYSDDINFPEYFSVEPGIDVLVQLDITDRSEEYTPAKYVKDGKYHEGIPLKCVDADE